MKKILRTFSAGAFTLIELLIVIGIIVLLIAVVIPVLSRARERARVSVCASNLKQIGIGIASYATDSVGERIPPFYNGLKDKDWFNFGWGWEPPYYGPWTTLVCEFSPGGMQGPINHAILYEKKYTLSPRVFYCPSATWREWQYPSPDLWLKLPITGSISIFGSYNYNPHTSDTNMNNSFPKYHRRQDIPSNECLVIDNILCWRKDNDISHKPNFGWNMAFSDGHVEFRSSSAALKLFVNAGPGVDQWSYIQPALALLESQ